MYSFVFQHKAKLTMYCLLPVMKTFSECDRCSEKQNNMHKIWIFDGDEEAYCLLGCYIV